MSTYTAKARPGSSHKSLTPERSLAQRLAALERANEVRTRRAQLKRDLAAGRVRLEDLLEDPPEWLETAKVFDLMLHVPKFGRVKVNKVFRELNVSPSKTLGGMTMRQRVQIEERLRR